MKDIFVNVSMKFIIDIENAIRYLKLKDIKDIKSINKYEKLLKALDTPNSVVDSALIPYSMFESIISASQAMEKVDKEKDNG